MFNEIYEKRKVHTEHLWTLKYILGTMENTYWLQQCLNCKHMVTAKMSFIESEGLEIRDKRQIKLSCFLGIMKYQPVPSVAVFLPFSLPWSFINFNNGRVQINYIVEVQR
jgi:hypothetical protein